MFDEKRALDEGWKSGIGYTTVRASHTDPVSEVESAVKKLRRDAEASQPFIIDSRRRANERHMGKSAVVNWSVITYGTPPDRPHHPPASCCTPITVSVHPCSWFPGLKRTYQSSTHYC